MSQRGGRATVWVGIVYIGYAAGDRIFKITIVVYEKLPIDGPPMHIIMQTYEN